MAEVHYFDDDLDFGPLPAAVDTLLKRGVAAHARQPDEAEADFRAAIALHPEALPAYRCLVKHFNRLRRFDEALSVVERWIGEAGRQAGLDAPWQCWRAAPYSALAPVKAYAFIQLRRSERGAAAEAVQCLQRLDPSDGLGGSVVAALLASDADSTE